MVSDRLLSIVCCPDCRHRLQHAAAITCTGCGRRFPQGQSGFLDLQPAAAFAERTRYLEEALHADARHERVSPPLLAAAVRNDLLRAMLQPTAGDRVADLGCGSGRMAIWNQDLAGWTVGVDVSPHFAHEARERIDLVLGDLRRLPFPDASFTKGYALDVLEHLSPSALQAMLGEAARVLVPGGRLFVYSHVRKNSRLAWGLRVINRFARGLERVGLIDLTQERLRKADHVNPLADIAELHRVVEVAGFRLASIRYYTPLVGGFIENVVVRLAEGFMARRAARHLRESAGGAARGSDTAAVREARTTAKAALAKGGLLLAVAQGLTWMMKLDLVLFGRIRSGPFFALLVKPSP